MIYLALAVVLVGVLCLLNLVLSLAIIRRLRRQTEQDAQGVQSSRVTLPKGTPLPEFTAMTTDDVPLSTVDLRDDRAVIAFFAATCQPCHTALPEFADLARTHPGGPKHVLAVVNGSGPEADEFVEALSGLAHVVVEPELGPVAQAFSVTVFPAFYLADEDGRIVAGTPTVRMLTPELV
jgi:peroxiredoxin